MTFLIRRQRFRELCRTGPAVRALRYLQTDVHAVVDHTNVGETTEFRDLLELLMTPQALSSADESATTTAMDTDERAAQEERAVEERRKVFEQILEFVDEEQKEPKQDLQELVTRATLASRS
jgi:muskelin